MLLALDERLVEFSFASRFEGDVQPDSILRLARQSWSANRRAGVTGFLQLDGARLEQTVEGPSTLILGLASRILTDRRHCEIVILRFGPIFERRFADWSITGLAAAEPAPQGPRAALRLLKGISSAPRLDDSPRLAVAGAT